MNRISILTVCEELKNLVDKKHVATDNTTTSALQQEVEMKDAEIQRMNAQIQDKDAQIQYQANELLIKDAQIEMLQSEVNKLKLQITASQVDFPSKQVRSYRY